jgi:hypothetical protein
MAETLAWPAEWVDTEFPHLTSKGATVNQDTRRTKLSDYPRESKDSPSENAFCLVAPTVLLSDLEILLAGVFCCETVETVDRKTRDGSREQRARGFDWDRSADHIRASSHNGCTQTPDTWLHPNASRKRQILFPCTAGAVHT